MSVYFVVNLALVFAAPAGLQRFSDVKLGVYLALDRLSGIYLGRESREAGGPVLIVVTLKLVSNETHSSPDSGPRDIRVFPSNRDRKYVTCVIIRLRKLGSDCKFSDSSVSREVSFEELLSTH